MLTKNVNGVDVPMSAEEEAQIRADWAKHDETVTKREGEAHIAALEKKLKDTDWYVIRSAEIGKPIPLYILEERALCRSLISDIRETIK